VTPGRRRRPASSCSGGCRRSRPRRSARALSHGRLDGGSLPGLLRRRPATSRQAGCNAHSWSSSRPPSARWGESIPYRRSAARTSRYPRNESRASRPLPVRRTTSGDSVPHKRRDVGRVRRTRHPRRRRGRTQRRRSRSSRGRRRGLSPTDSTLLSLLGRPATVACRRSATDLPRTCSCSARPDLCRGITRRAFPQTGHSRLDHADSRGRGSPRTTQDLVLLFALAPTAARACRAGGRLRRATHHGS